MPDNTLFHASQDLAMPRIADREVAHSGENAKVQLIALVEVIGTEGAATLREYAALDTLLTTLNARQAVETLQTATVAIGGNLSTEIDLTGIRNWGFFVPSTFDGTQIEFHISSTSGGSYAALYDIANTIVRMTVTAGRWYDSPGEVMWARYLKINCVTVQATTVTDFLVAGRS